MNPKHIGAFIIVIDISFITAYGIWAAADYDKDSYMSVEEKIEQSHNERGNRDICYPVSRCIDNSTGIPYVVSGNLYNRVCDYNDWLDTKDCNKISSGLYIGFIILSICLYSSIYVQAWKDWFRETPQMRMMILHLVIVILTIVIYWSIPVSWLKLDRLFVIIGVAIVRMLAFIFILVFKIHIRT
jgi:hypothetical protein